MCSQLINILFVLQGPCWVGTSIVLTEPAPALSVSAAALALGWGWGGFLLRGHRPRNPEGPRLQERKIPGPELESSLRTSKLQEFSSVALIDVELQAQ